MPPGFWTALSSARWGYVIDFLAIILLQAAMTMQSHAQATSPPEIAASLPSGEYAGRAHKNGKGFDVSLVIDETKPGGRIRGSVVIHKAPAPCEGRLPINGEIRPGGGVHIEAKDGASRGCKQTLNLKLAGDELTGTLVGSEGPLPINLKKQ